ncbi:MAG: hypothetical protein FIB07_05950 [Candidatus Methanoperedens sp.]|nr:hypothetical protein [Candidatus Methanoperedens sp.]
MIRGRTTFVFIVILSLLIISGCMSQEPTGTPAAMPTATPIETVTPVETATVIPTQQPVTVSAPATITITSIPGRPVENSSYTIKWQVSGGTAGDITKTELLWDSKKGNATVNDYSQSTLSMTGKTPMEFNQTLKAGPSSTIYFRAHAIVDGIEIFSDEKQMTIYPEHETGY